MSTVSIILPYYKKREFIKETLNSIINQSYKDFEVIIIYDDESVEDLDFIKNIIVNDDRIKLIVNNKNLGVGPSRNIGINNSIGSYLAFIDGDDLWKNDKLIKQISFMEENNYLISHTSYEIINAFGKKLSHRKAENLNYKKLLKSCDIGLSSVILKKELLKDNLRFANLKTKEDFVLWLKISENGNTIYGLEDNLLFWRKTKNSLSSSTIRKLIDGFLVYYKYLGFNFIKSLYYLLILSINYLRKSS